MTKIIFIDKFPLSNQEKLTSCVESLLTYNLTIKNYPQKKYGYRVLFSNYSLETCKVITTIIENQIKVYRSILFPNEFKKLWSYCPICQTKRFYSRTSEHHDSQTSLSKMFKCNSCHYLEFESILDDTIPKHQYQRMNCPPGFFDDIISLFEVLEKVWLYVPMNIPYQDFFIKLDKNKLACPICKKVCNNRTAIQHYKAILNKKTNPPCNKYYQLNVRQVR